MPNILIAGKDLPESLDICEAFARTGRKIFTVSKSESDIANFESENIFAAPWNRASAVSARSLIIKSETRLQKTDEILIYFDAPPFAEKFISDRTEDVSRGIDCMISGFQYLTAELIRRIEEKKERITISFMLRTCPTKHDLIHSGAAKGVNVPPAGIIVSGAQAAFAASAENAAAVLSEKDYVSVFLVQNTPSNEFYKNEKETAKWLVGYFDGIEGLKSRQNPRTCTTWIKVGAKLSGGFSLFR